MHTLRRGKRLLRAAARRRKGKCRFCDPLQAENPAPQDSFLSQGKGLIFAQKKGERENEKVQKGQGAGIGALQLVRKTINGEGWNHAGGRSAV